MNAPLPRRSFLALCGAALVAIVAAACGGGGSKARLGALVSVYPDRAALEAIGARAVAAREVGRNAPHITSALRPRGSAEAWLETMSPPAIKRHLERLVANDFETDRLVDVAGWQLSVTEARVAGLFYLAR
jgi:hypothetical protein